MSDIVIFIFVGFFAQLIDGALGMAYGLFSTSVLLSYGVPPATASASVHAAEVFTTGISGFSHWRFGNIDFKFLRRLVPAGMIGGAIGAYIVSEVHVDTIKMFVAIYLTGMGIYILRKAFRKLGPANRNPKFLPLLGFSGGMLDAIGGGGWGPLVTSNLVGQGVTPRFAVGSTNLAEFFVTLTISATFVVTIGLDLWPIITGLIIGGALAAPIAAMVAKRVPARGLMITVGAIIVLLSLRTLYLTFA